MEELKLKQDVPTRCNPTCIMLQRFYKNRIALLVCIKELKIKCNLTNEDWYTIAQCVEILRFFDEATNMFQLKKLPHYQKWDF